MHIGTGGATPLGALSSLINFSEADFGGKSY